MNDDTFHFSENDDDECPLDISLPDELKDKNPNTTVSNETNAVSDESPGSEVLDFIECEQQENFPFIKGTEPSEEMRAVLRKCQAYAHFYEMPSVFHSLERRSDGAGYSRAGTPYWGPILRTVAVAGLNTLLLGDGDSWTTASLGSALISDEQCASPVKRVLVHHELQPTVRRYLALLQENGALAVLSFPQLKVMSRFSSVASVTSADKDWEGLPSLLIVKCSGERVRWSPLFSDAVDVSNAQPPVPAAKLQVAAILQSKLHTAYDRLQRLEYSCRQREVFISTHVDTMLDVLAGGGGAGATSGGAGAAGGRAGAASGGAGAVASTSAASGSAGAAGGRASAAGAASGGAGAASGGAGVLGLPLAQTALASVTVSNSLCRVVSVRCKALHSDALLVCAAVSNCSSRLLLSDLELVLNLQSEHREDRTSAGKSNHPHLEYKSFVYKSVMRVSKQTSTTAKNKGDCAESRDRVPHGENNASGSGVRLRMGGGESKSATHIEPLIPCLLRPKKQAYVIGVCRMPIFSSGRYLNITGLVRFKTKPLSLQDNKSHLHYSPYSGTTPHSSDNSCVNAADNRSGSTASRDDFSARKRKEFVSRECDSSQKLNPPTASPKEESFSAVEDFICRKGGVYVKSWYPEYAGNSTDCVYQVPIKTISIDALRIDAMKVSLTAPPPKAGVSLDSLALISGSERCKVLLQSPICGLSIDRLLSELAQRCDIRQVADVDNVYVLCAADSSASLHHCALSLSQQEQRCVSADLYFRDVRQGLMLVHTLKAVLPFDATICPAEAGMPSRRDACVLTAAVDPVQLLHEKMRKTAQFLSRGIRNKFSLRGDREEEQTKKKSKLAKDSKFHETRSVGEIYDEERKLFESRATFMVDRANYEEWRLQLETLLAEFHEAYLQAHECEQ